MPVIQRQSTDPAKSITSADVSATDILTLRGNTILAPTTDVSLTRCRHIRCCLLSAAATWRSLTPFPGFVCGWLDVHTCLTGCPRRRRRRVHWALWCGVYDGADYTTFILPKTRFCVGIGMCGLCAYARYVHKNTILQLLTLLLLRCIAVLHRCGLLLQTKYHGLSVILPVTLSYSWDLQKQLNRWSCRLGCGRGWAQGSMY